MNGRRGFTLIELSMAVGLMTVVTAAVMLITTSAIRTHFEQIRNGEDSTAELYGIDQMVRTLENTTHFEHCYPPTNPTPPYCGPSFSYQEIRGCWNYSQSFGGAMGGAPSWYDFCWSPPGGNPNGMATLFKYTGTVNVCPVGAWPTTGVACGAAVGGANVDAVAVNFYPARYPASNAIFARNWSGGIDMNFMVGIATANFSGVGVPGGYKTQAMPVVYRMATGSGTQEGYSGPTCGAGWPCD